LKRYRERETSNINEEVDTYLYHLTKMGITLIECPLEWWGKINRIILMLRLERENGYQSALHPHQVSEFSR
jgi:hypothetical protein